MTANVLTEPSRKEWGFLDSAFGAAYLSHDGLKVIRTVHDDNEWGDNRIWMHVSYSRKDRIPSYEDSKRVLRAFVGDELEAYAVYPPKARWVNVHPHCLHFWIPLEGPILPDLSYGGKII